MITVILPDIFFERSEITTIKSFGEFFLLSQIILNYHLSDEQINEIENNCCKLIREKSIRLTPLNKILPEKFSKYLIYHQENEINISLIEVFKNIGVNIEKNKELSFI